MKLRLLNSKLAAILVAMAAVSSGCAHLGKAGVGVQNLTADVVFGVKKPDKAAPAPANFPSSDSGSFDVPPDLGGGTTATTKKPFPFANATPVSNCPAATVTAAPKAISNSDVEAKPLAGDYRWKRKGSITAAGSKIGVGVGGFEPRQIFDVHDASPDLSHGMVDITYKTSQFDLIAPSTRVITSWHVRHLPGDDPPVSSVRGRQVPRQGGIYITAIERHEKTSSGENVSNFTPAGKGVMVLPLPADVGAAFNSVGVDPKTFDTFQNQGTIKQKVFVDACGELIDTLRVEAQQDFTSGGATSTQAYNYEIATSLGGLLVGEQIKSTLANGSTLDVTNTVGQVRPSPLSAPAS